MKMWLFPAPVIEKCDAASHMSIMEMQNVISQIVKYWHSVNSVELILKVVVHYEYNVKWVQKY